jgi:glycosyltransferase involved in cell wall biosynthesis
MRILHVTSSLRVGGAEAVLYDLAAGLQRRGHTQGVACIHPGPFAARIEALGIAVTVGWNVHRAVRRFAPDVVHSLLWAANFLMRFASVPVVAAHHLPWPSEGKLRNALDRATLRFVRPAVAVAPHVQASLPFPSRVIANAVDTHRIRAAIPVPRAALGLQDDDFVVGSVGRLIARKGFTRLVTMFARLQLCCAHARLVLVGAGPDEQALRRLAQDLGIDPWVRWVRADCAHGYFSLFDAFVLPSHTEGDSIAMHEARAWGVPVVTDDWEALDHLAAAPHRPPPPVSQLGAMIDAYERMFAAASGHGVT